MPDIPPLGFQSTDIGLRLYIGVRFFWNSIETIGAVDIDVWIDEKPVSVGTKFPSALNLKCPDSVYVHLNPGVHTLRAVSVEGEAALEQKFELSEDSCFMSLSLNYYPKDSELWETNREDANPGFDIVQQGKNFGWR